MRLAGGPPAGSLEMTIADGFRFAHREDSCACSPTAPGEGPRLDPDVKAPHAWINRAVQTNSVDSRKALALWAELFTRFPNDYGGPPPV